MGSETNPMGMGPEAMFRMWSDWATNAMAASQNTTGSTNSPEMVRQMRATFFKMWSDAWEELLRSPAFLEQSKQLLTDGADFQKQAREYLGKLQHDLQLASAQDMDQLALAIRRLERRMMDQFEDLSDQLDRLSKESGSAREDRFGDSGERRKRRSASENETS